MPILPDSKKLTYWISLIGFVTALGTSYFAIDSHYAKAEEVKKIELRLEQKIVGDRSDKIQERIWKFEDRYKTKDQAPPEIQEQWRILEKELVANEDKLKRSFSLGQSRNAN